MLRQYTRCLQLIIAVYFGCFCTAFATESVITQNILIDSYLFPVTIFLVILLITVLIIQRKRIRGFEQKVISSHEILEVTLKRTRREVERVRQACELASLIYYEYDIERNIFTGDSKFFILIVGEIKPYITFSDFLQHVHSEDINIFDAYSQSAPQNYSDGDDNVIKAIVRIYDANNTLRYLHFYAKSVFDNDGKLIIRRGSIIDVTDQKQRELELSIINKQLKYAQRMARIFTWEVNINEPDIIRISQDFYKFLGSEYEQTNKVHTSVLREVLSSEDYNTVVNAINNCFLTGKGFDITIPVYPRNGDEVMYIRSVLFTNENAGIERGVISGVFQDITDIKNSERKAGHEEKIKALGRLASGIAHDFNNQLSGILGFAELIKTEEVSDTVLEYTNMVIDRGEKSVELVRKLLDFSRNQKEEVELIDVDYLIDDTVKFFSHLVSDSVKVKKYIKAGGLGVLGNYNELQNALLNLCINSRDSLSDRSGHIILEVSSILVSSDEAVKLQIAPGKFIVINVVDNGAGMPDEVKKKALDPFFTTKPEGKGTGLGLSTVHSTITALAGAINIESKVDKGTTVRLYLPVASDSVIAKKDKNLKTQGIKRGTGSVLIIDDDKSLVKLLTMQLNKAGYVATGINNPVEAVKVYSRDHEKFDLVILDMIMPKMNGAAVQKALKDINKDVKIIIMSAYSDDELFEKVKKEGITHFLTKPVTLTVLTKTVADVLNNDESGVE